jgi:diacylglycerol kinase
VTIGLVLFAEMGNSAIEETVNLMIREHRKEAKFAKDFAAGMVLLASVIAIAVGFFLFGPKIFQILPINPLTY